MSYKLFLDDERHPVTNDWVIARSSDEAIRIVQERGMPSEIAFDHDLGGTDTSMKFIWFFIDCYYDGELTIPNDFKYTVHSQNPIGVRNIKGLMENFLNGIKE